MHNYQTRNLVPQNSPAGAINETDLGTKARFPWRYLSVLAIAAFLVNWPWELLVIPAYREVSDWPWVRAAFHCSLATVGDAFVTLAIYGVGALASGQPDWGLKARWNVFAAASLLGSLAALMLEWRALATGRWSYSEVMPIVPGLGVGLWPLLQLPLLVPLAFWLARRWVGMSHS